MGPLTKAIMNTALLLLNQKMKEQKFENKVSLIMGGGGAMILAHGFPKGTTDIDAIPRGMSPDVLKPLIQEIAEELKLESDWLNPYFSTFSHTLPADYGSRLITVMDESHLKVEALGKEEMLIMKCFAHRTKDIPHARALLRSKVNLEIVENRLDELKKKKIPGVDAAIDFLQEVTDEMDEE